MPGCVPCVDIIAMFPSRRLAALVVSSVSAAVVCAAAPGGTVHPNSADQALAKAAVLHLSDFTPGAGWVAVSPPSGNSGSAATNASCAAASSSTGLTETGHAESAFRTSGFYVESWATVLQTPAMVQLDWRRSTPQIIGCLRSALRQSLHAGTTLTSVVALPFPKVAPLVQAYRAAVSVSVQGQAVPMIADMLVYARGRIEFELLQVSPQSFASEAKTAEQRIASTLSLRAAA